ncbi:MAG: glycosyltransferase family 39 protein [Candidatus Omnitrophota bacterium]
MNATLRAKAPAIAMLFLVAVLYLSVSVRHEINRDESESLYASYLISNGQVIYKDFYQMHPPLFYYLISPVFKIFDTIPRVFYSARIIVFIMCLLTGAVIYRVNKDLFNPKVGFFAFLSFMSCYPVIKKLTEVRPDSLVTLAGCTGILCFILAGRRPRIYHVLAGILCCLALLSKQSGIVFLPVMICMYVFSRGKGIYKFLAGYLATLALFISFLYFSGGWGRFFKYSVNNDFLNTLLMRPALTERYVEFHEIYCYVRLNFALIVFSIAAFYALAARKIDMPRQGVLFAVSFILIAYAELALSHTVFLQHLITISIPLATLSGIGLYYVYTAISSASFRSGVLRYFKKVYMTVVFMVVFLPLFVYFQDSENMLCAFESKDDLRLKEEIIANTNEDDRLLFPMDPVYLRPSIYHYFLCPFVIEWDRQIEDRIIGDIYCRRIVMIEPFIVSDESKMPRLSAVIKRNYVMNAAGYYIPGQSIMAEAGIRQGFEILVPGYYKVSGAGDREIDGMPLDNGALYLARGYHALELPRERKCYIIYDLPRNRRKQPDGDR